MSGLEGTGDQERTKLAARAGVVGAGTLASRVLGLVRDQTLAALFSRADTDAFWVAFTLPNALRQLVGEGAAAGAVVPVLAEVRAEEGDEGARRFFARMRGISLVALAVVTVSGMVFAPELVELFASGFHARPGAFERTVELTRWVFPYIFFMGTAALGMAALNTYGRFAAAAFAPMLLNVGLVACAFLLRGPLSERGFSPLLALAIGALLGGAMQVVMQWPSLRKIGMLSAPKWSPFDPRVKRAMGRMLPMTAGIGIYYVDLVLSRRFLSDMPEGSQSYFSWAMRLCDFPQGIFVMALQAATLPSLAALAARGDLDEVGKTYAYAMRLSMFVAIPATALLVGLSEPIVITLFERGAFDAGASAETARALVAQGLGVFAIAAVRQLVAVYYALGDTRTPVIVSALDLGAFIALALGLRGVMGHVGVGVAVTGSSIVQMLLLWGRLGKRLPSLHLGEIAFSTAKTALLALLAAFTGHFAARGAAGFVGSGGLSRALPGIVGIATFGMLFLVGARLSGSAELEIVVSGLRRRFGRNRSRVA